MRFLESVAMADSGTAAAQPSFLEGMIPFVFIFFIMYFFIIRPQAKKAKDHAALLSALKPGDEVVTTGGIIGRVKSVSDGFVSLDVGTTIIKVMKEHIGNPSAAKVPALKKT